MFIFRRVTELKRIDPTRFQELLALAATQPSGFNPGRLKDLVRAHGLWAELNDVAILHRIRRLMDPMVELGYIRPDTASSGWYVPCLDVIERETRMMMQEVAKQMEEIKAHPDSWATGGGVLLAALDGAGVGEAGKKGTAKAEAKIGKYGKKS